MPDFTQPGVVGAPPFTISEWRRGTVYTVHPEILSPLVRGQEYRSTAIVRYRVSSGDRTINYGDLYRRAMSLAAAREGKVSCSSVGQGVHTWIRVHAWGELEVGQLAFAFATLSLSLLFPSGDQDTPVGEVSPTANELLAPGGSPRGAFSQQIAGGETPAIGELYNDFDFALVPGPGMFSYGEYVPSADGVNFEPFVARAEVCAKEASGVQNIVAREWYCTTHPDLAVVHLFYEA